MHRHRLLGSTGVAVALIASGLIATSSYAEANPVASPQAGVAAPQAHRPATNVGSIRLHACHVLARAQCGSLRRAWDPADPSGGTIKVGIVFVPARDTTKPVLGTFVPHEGGPGYSTNGTGSSYAEMYGPLLRRHNMLLVDQRGTGRSEPIDCKALQNLKGPYAPAAATCGAQLGSHADQYSTALSADDLAAVIKAMRLGRVDVYGDSYGTFFAQVFAGRHPGLVRSVLLDSAYPTYGETAWYPTQGPAMRRAFAVVCRRSRPCRNAGRPFLPTLEQVLAVVRTHPYHGRSHDADGRPMRVTVDGATLVTVAFGATYGPAFYREFTAALRSALRGDRAPLLRLVAEATGGGTYAGAPADYSEGDDAAVSCHDYPQLYDMTASPATRRDQYQQALTRRTARHPHTYAPFTIREYAASDWQELDWCTDWPSAPASNPAGPPRPPGGSYGHFPVLVFSGELDSITTQAEGAIVASQFPNARQVVFANSFHVNAYGDTQHCAVRVARAFFAHPHHRLSAGLLRCAGHIGPVRAMGVFPTVLHDVRPAAGNVDAHRRRVGPAAAATVADVVDRWWNNYSGSGFGLRGGHWSYTGGDRVVRFHLHRVRLVRNLAVSGTAVWVRYRNRIRVDLRVDGDAHGRLLGSWNANHRGARARLHGTVGGRRVTLVFRAP